MLCVSGDAEIDAIQALSQRHHPSKALKLALAPLLFFGLLAGLAVSGEIDIVGIVQRLSRPFWP